MKAILMSIQPKWCEKIFNGEKTIEVRKTAPKPPFKVYIYCTKGRDSLVYSKDREWNGKVVAEFVCNEVDTIINLGNAFEIKDKDKAYTNTVARNSCLVFSDLQKYLKNKNGCAIHITDLKLYDKPKELSEFYSLNCNLDEEGLYKVPIYNPPQSWMYVEE